MSRHHREPHPLMGKSPEEPTGRSLIRPVIRTAHVVLSRIAERELRDKLRVKTCRSIFKTKLSLLLDPDDQRRAWTIQNQRLIKDTTIDIVLTVPASEVPSKFRQKPAKSRNPYVEAAVPVAALFVTSDGKAVSAELKALLNDFPLPYWAVDAGASDAITGDISWTDVDTLHAWFGLRSIDNPWNLDVFRAALAIAPKYGLNAICEVALSELVDVAAYCRGNSLDARASRFLRRTTVDVALCTNDTIAFPVALIHVDSHYHDKPERKKADDLVNQVAKAAGLLTCRTRLDGGRTSRPYERRAGPGSRDYWERLVAAVTATCVFAKETAERHTRRGIVSQITEALIAEVAKYSPNLAADLRVLTNLVNAELRSQLERSMAATERIESEYVNTPWEPEEDPAATAAWLGLFEIDADEDRLRRLGPVGFLDAVEARERRSDGYYFSCSHVTRTGRNVLGLKPSQRYVPKGSATWKGEGANAARDMYYAQIRDCVRRESLEAAVEAIRTSPSIGDAILADWRRATEQGHFLAELESWNRLSLDGREARIKDRLTPRLDWIRPDLDLDDFYSGAAVLDPASAQIDATERQRLVERLEREKAALLRLIAGCDSSEDDKALLVDAIDGRMSAVVAPAGRS